MNNVKASVLNSGPPITRPRKRHSVAQIAKPLPPSTSFRGIPSSPSQTSHNSSNATAQLNPSLSFSLGCFLHDKINGVKSTDDIFNHIPAALDKKKKPFLRKGNMDQRRYSLDFSSVLTTSDLLGDSAAKPKKPGGGLSGSNSFRKVRFSLDCNSMNDSPLAFNGPIDEDSDEPEDEGQPVIITIHSNWGSPDFVRISSLTILDDKFMSVPVLKSTTSPDLGIETRVLFDGHLIKKNINELFTIPWSPDHEPVRLVIVVPSGITISGVRIFNSEVATESSVKDISISLDNSTKLKGEIPKNFGIDFKFTNEMKQDAIESSRLIEDFFSENREKPFQDKYGYYPLFSTKTLSFELKKSWSDENFIGLNGIQIYDQYNKLITMDDIDDIIVHHGGSSNDPSLLFKDDLQTSRPERQFLMKLIPNECPFIEIIFKEERFLTKVVIWNFNSSRDPVEYGTKYIKLCSDENILWCGRIAKSIGNEKSADKKIKTLWLTDSASFKNQTHDQPDGQSSILV